MTNNVFVFNSFAIHFQFILKCMIHHHIYDAKENILNLQLLCQHFGGCCFDAVLMESNV